MNKSIYKLELHENTWNNKINKDILRVASGWIYSEYDQESDRIFNSIFVPFDNKFDRYEDPKQ